MIFSNQIKKRFFLIAGMVILVCVGVYGQSPFHQHIYVPANLDKAASEAVTDMAYWLQKVTGKDYIIEENSSGTNASGIYLEWSKEANIAAELKKQLNKDGQSFYLAINGDKDARIIATGKSSFINGIYTFLHELGFRWYMPGEAWTILPKKIGSGVVINKIYTPDFRNRIYAGSGGLRPIPGVDPKNTFQKDFDLWNLRNRFSSDYYSKGHTGHLFYAAQKKELDKNPGWFCKGMIDPYGRIDISKPKAVDLFVQWALTQVKPEDPYPVIGVDPSDGSGGKDDCLPTGMKAIRSWSDKYFWLANQVAENLPPDDHKTIVQLYAYGEHAPLPGFDLHDDIYPVIIPYAFQRVTTPENFIKKWNQKLEGRPMGIYDYWNITQWSIDLPQFNIYSIPEKLRFWKQYNITTIHLESTNAKGPMGHSFWLASQMMWNTTRSFDSLYKQFLNDCFGAAATDIKKMYDRWSLNYQSKMEVNLSLQDLAAAASKTKDESVLKRIGELKAYIHYLKLYFEYRDNSSVAAYNKLINYIHQIHPLRLLQTWALQRYYIIPPKNYVPPALKESKDFSEPSIEKLYGTIERNFKEDIENTKFFYHISGFNFDISKVKPVKTEKNNILNVTGPNRYEFKVSREKAFRIGVGSTVENKLAILDIDGNMILEKAIPASKTGYTYIETKLEPGKYSVLTGTFGGFTRIDFPTDVAFVSSLPILYYDNTNFPLLYIYVPAEVSEIVYEDNYGPGTNKRGFWIDPNGNKVNPEKIRPSVYRINVPLSSRGKTWVLNIGHRSFSVLNIPHRFSLVNFSYDEDR